MTRRIYLMIVGASFLLLMILGSLLYSWFVLINRTDSFIATAAKVDADFMIYINGSYEEPDWYTFIDGQSVVKSGVYRINVSDINADDFITNLRVDIKVKSTVNTYVRVAIIDSLTLATIDFQGNRGEVAIVDQPINYAISRHWLVNDILYYDIHDAEIALGGISANDVVVMLPQWYNNTLSDGFYYYPQLIECDMDTGTQTISFIEEYDGAIFRAKSVGYSLQFAIIVEAIQAGHHAPIHNWGLLTPPWGGEWA
jgi:hypothetical protein